MSRFRPSRNYISGEFVITGGPVDITGDLVVSGSITANQYNVNVINTNVTHIDADGSTKFGDSADDTHVFTGSVFIDGPLSASSIIGGGATTPGAPLTSVQYNDAGAFAGDANFTWDDTTSALTVTGDITASSNISGAFFYGDGSGLTNIVATATPAGSNTQIQYNADGALGADADFTWSSGSNTLNVNGYISSSAIAISSSNPAETLLNISGYNFPNLLNVDASSSLDGGARVMIRNSNDDIIEPNTPTFNRGVLHIEQDSTSSVASDSNGLTIWTTAQENYASQIRLHTWNPPPGNGSALYFYTNEGDLPAGFVGSGQALGRINFGGQATTQTQLGYFLQVKASQTWNGSAINSSYLQFFSVPPGLGGGTNIKERIRFTGEGHIIVFPYSASNGDVETLPNNFIDSSGAPAIQVYGPSLFGSSSLNTHTFTGSVNISGDLSASLNVSASAFYGDGSNLTNLPAGSPAGSNTQVQFNADGAFGADNALTWASGSNTLTVSGTAEINELQFDTVHVATGHTTGRLYWDDNAKTITADMQGSDVRLQIGQEEHVYVQNASGVTINNGDAVRISGAAGTNIQVEKAISEIRSFTAPVEQDSILGIATEEILNNQFGYITTFGAVRDLDTSTFSTGDILYLSHTTSGSYTNVKPPAPYFPARVGIVEVVNATEGVILSRPGEPTFLTDIAGITGSDVPVGTKSYLCYDDTTQILTLTDGLSGSFSGSFQGDGSNLTGLARDFGPSATDPVGSPNAGDFYYNTVLNMTMHYDSSRTKWLSAETAEITFGRNGNTAAGAFYRGPGDRAYSSTLGRYAEHSGTVVSISYTRSDTDAAIFNVTSDGTTFSFLSSSAAAGNSATLDDDFSPSTVLGVKNQSVNGNPTTDVMGVVRIKWRA